MTGNEKRHHLPRRWPLPLLEERWPWEEIFTTEETFRGRYFFLYNINEEEPITGLPGLSHILPIADSGLHCSPLLVPSEEGLMKFALLGVPPETNLQEERSMMTLKTMLSARWLFGVEWVSGMSAWEALLFTFENMHPLRDCLPVSFMLPTLFVARMADQPRSSVFDSITTWAPLLDDIQERLLALLLALILHWFDGPSQTAQELRRWNQEESAQLAEEKEDMAFFQDLLDAFAQIFGPERLETFLLAPKLEPAVMRLVDQASAYLWDPTIFLSDQQQSVLQAHPDFYALLPIAFWNTQAPIALDRGHDQYQSLENLYAIWQSWHKAR